MAKKENSASSGGLSEGPSHENGGIPGTIKSTGEPIEFEGGEIIINKQASKENCEELSKINQSAGNGVAFNCDTTAPNPDQAKAGALLNEDVDTDYEEYRSGGNLAEKSDNNKVRKIKVRFHLGKGKDFMKWKIENKETGTNEFLDPETHQLIMTNCKLTNSPATAMKIYTGAINKSPIAYVQCEKIEITKNVKPISQDERLAYNPRTAPNWFDNNGENIDNFVFDKLITHGRSVYYDDGTNIYKLGGVTEFATGGQTPGGGDQLDLFENATQHEIEEVVEKIKKKKKPGPREREIARLSKVALSKQRKELTELIFKKENNTKVLIAFSGGKDSVGLVLHALYVLKIPASQIELWHHDVDGAEDQENLWDWKCTRSYCQAFADHFKIPLLFSYSDGGITREIYKQNEWRQPVYFQKEAGGPFFVAEPDRSKAPKDKLKFPAVSPQLDIRWCSSIAKIEVMNKAITNNEDYKKANLVIMTGERRVESKNRSKYKEIEPYKGGYGLERKAYTWRTVIDYTNDEIWGLLEKHKVQPHPAYMLGWGRCSCQTCIFSGKDTWASINEISPEKIKRIAEIEKDLKAKGSDMPTLYHEQEKIESGRFYKKDHKTNPNIKKGDPIMTSTGVQVDNIYDARVNMGESFIRKDNAERWKKEALGEFVSPIIVKTWVKPQGQESNRECGAN